MSSSHTIGDRIRQVRESAGLNQAEFAEKLGLHKNTLGLYERNKRVPDANLFLGLWAHFRVDVGWILGLEGRRTQEATSPFVSYMIDPFAQPMDELAEGEQPAERRGAEIQESAGFPGSPTADTAVRTPDQTPAAGHRTRPGFRLVGKAKWKLSDGGGIVPEEGLGRDLYAFRSDWLHSVAVAPKRVFLIDVDGDSMAPTVEHGDTLLIDQGRTELRDGRIYAIAVGGVVQVKRLQLVAGGRIRVISDNPAYHSYEVGTDEIRIIGRMIWFARSLV